MKLRTRQAIVTLVFVALVVLVIGGALATAAPSGTPSASVTPSASALQDPAEVKVSSDTRRVGTFIAIGAAGLLAVAAGAATYGWPVRSSSQSRQPSRAETSSGSTEE
ncbi:hypothetical protein M3G03_02640 [Aestuariimicrobium sp. p3-SID1156]|uniref:hypothetical protein n=1 Tax=Aestuariimicrobium sp. p3-SID1156 TaxID=2916038 RepID=UPI00223C323C|nr:hypothetical protein [Aestuariimicrobium sp. p3-SID1156]MCT1458449.1 hypothetical protein [Aestuariimicrobium sp. p3-SID1156]